MHTGESLHRPNARGIARNDVDTSAYLNELKDILAGLSNRSPRTRHRRFFAEFDQETAPNMYEVLLEERKSVDPFTDWDGERASRDRCIRLVKHRLVERLRERKRVWAAEPGRLPEFDALSDDERNEIGSLSKLQLDLIRAHYANADGVIDVTKFNEGFEGFATGWLSLPVPGCGAWASEIDSGYYFCFGEFALLAIDAGSDADEWTRLVDVLIRTQPVFAQIYAPTGVAKPDLNDYEPKNFRAKTASAARKQLKLDTAKRMPLTLDELQLAASLHAHTYLQGV